MSTDIPDLIAGALGVSRGTAYDMMRDVLAEQPAQQRVEELLDIFKDVDQCGPLLGMGQPAQQEPKKDLMYSTVAMQERHAAFVDRAVATLEQAKREALAEQPAQQEPVAFSQFLSDVVTAAGLLSHGKTDKSLAARISEFAFRLRTSPQPAQRKPLTDEQIDRAIAELGLNYFADAANNRAVLRELCRKAAHGIKGQP